MNHLNDFTKGAFITAIAAAALYATIPAHADPQYQQDRAYCMSGQASEARDLCLREAAAAQAERQHASRGTHAKHASAQQSADHASDQRTDSTR